MIDQLRSEINDVQFYENCTDLDKSLYTVLSCSPKNDKSDMLLFNLDILGVAVVEVRMKFWK